MSKKNKPGYQKREAKRQARPKVECQFLGVQSDLSSLSDVVIEGTIPTMECIDEKLAKH